MFLTSKSSSIFYGWWIVSACFAISLFTGGFVILGFTAFFEPIANEFDWSYTQVSLAASIRGIEVGLLAPLVGLLVDHLGPRRMVFGGSVITGIGLILLSKTNSLGMFYGAFALIAVGYSGTSPTVIMAAVANWFRTKIGTATGIMACGFACGGLLVPIVVRLIDVFEWRNAILLLGLATWITGLPLSLLLRHKPEQYGYLPDGEHNNPSVPYQGQKLPESSGVEMGAMQVIKSRIFWHIVSSLMCQFFAISAIIVHVIPYLSSVGMVRATSSLVAMAIPLTSMIGRLSSGWVGDRFDKKQVSAGCFALIGLGLIFFSYANASSIWILAPFLIFFSIGWGGNVTMRAALLREYFGRSKFGTIHGFTMGILMLGSITGPLFAGWIFDKFGSYQMAWLTFAGFAFTALIIMATTPALKTPAIIDNNR